MDLLANYSALRRRVDERCRAIESAHAADIACRKGCSACCRHLNLFPVEAAALGQALTRLPSERLSALRRRAEQNLNSRSCPLLKDDACGLYTARPLICRTHGLPLLVQRDGQQTVDFCPENFIGVQHLDGTALIDLEALNTALAAVNALFVRAALPRADADWRPSIAQALTDEVFFRAAWHTDES